MKGKYDLEWFDYVGVCCAVVLAAVAIDRFGFAQKWIVPFTCTIVPSWCTARFLRKRWRALSLWVSLFVCTTLLAIGLSVVFGVVLGNITRVSFFVALPVGLGVLLPFYVIVEALERRLRSYPVRQSHVR